MKQKALPHHSVASDEELMDVEDTKGAQITQEQESPRNEKSL